MTIGFLLALTVGFIWSLVNVIDKVIVSKYIRNPFFITFIFCVLSLIIGLIALPFLTESFIGFHWFYVIFAGIGLIAGNVLYFFALKREEASRIVPLFSLVLVFITILSAIFLGEVFSIIMYAGIGLIIIGSFLISARRNFTKSFNNKSFWIMVLSTLSFAIAYTVNKYLLSEYSYWQIFSWQRIVVGLSGFVILLKFYPEFKQIVKTVKKRYIGIQSLAELISLAAALLFIMASAHWYVTLVESVVSVQYVFIFLWALIISRFKPDLFREEVNKKVIFQKITSILLIIIGIYLIV